MSNLQLINFDIITFKKYVNFLGTNGAMTNNLS